MTEHKTAFFIKETYNAFTGVNKYQIVSDDGKDIGSPFTNCAEVRIVANRLNEVGGTHRITYLTYEDELGWMKTSIDVFSKEESLC